jgi:prepilin-type N-terminal cleavage/methylation domain-containing protein
VTRRRGFTLVEVLLAITITGIVMGAVFAALFYTRVARDSIHNLAEIHSAGPAILDRIEEDLRHLWIYNLSGAQVFLGRNLSPTGVDADALDFVAGVETSEATLVEERWLRSRPCEVGYRLRPSPAEADFLELWRREDFFVDEDPFEGGGWTLVYDRMKYFNVTYFDGLGPDAEPYEEWSTEGWGRFPRRLQIDLAIETQPRFDRGQSATLTRNAPRVVEFTRTILLPDSLDRALEARLRPRIPERPQPEEGPGGVPAELSGGGAVTTAGGRAAVGGRVGGGGSGRPGGPPPTGTGAFNPFGGGGLPPTGGGGLPPGFPPFIPPH